MGLPQETYKDNTCRMSGPSSNFNCGDQGGHETTTMLVGQVASARSNQDERLPYSASVRPIHEQFKRLDTRLAASLTNSLPPVNYGVVQHGTVYRSGFPKEENINFMRGLHVRSILTLVDTTLSEGIQQYIRNDGIRHMRVEIAANKDDKISTSTESLVKALAFVLDPCNHPVWVHCNQGRHRTGCVIACLRKLQQWPLEDTILEYHAYAAPKSRNLDIALIERTTAAELAGSQNGSDHFPWYPSRVENARGLFNLTGSVLPLHVSATCEDGIDAA